MGRLKTSIAALSAASMLTGAAIASYPYWGGGYGGCWQVRPTYDAYGNYLGDQSVNVC